MQVGYVWPMESLSAQFLTWHNSNGDLHIRTDRGILFVPKTAATLIERFKACRRGDTIAVNGTRSFSKTLSSYVFEVAEAV
jgi:hypothetical protein